jgi:hypothetical protein
VTTGWVIAICWLVLILGIVVALYIASVRAPVREDDEGDLYRSRRLP